MPRAVLLIFELPSILLGKQNERHVGSSLRHCNNLLHSLHFNVPHGGGLLFLRDVLDWSEALIIEHKMNRNVSMSNGCNTLLPHVVQRHVIILMLQLFWFYFDYRAGGKFNFSTGHGAENICRLRRISWLTYNKLCAAAAAAHVITLYERIANHRK